MGWQPVPGLMVAIDGPSGSGKGTVAAMVGESLGLPVLDTGLLYRAVGELARREDLLDESTLCQNIEQLVPRIGWQVSGVTLDGQPATDMLRLESAGHFASLVAAMPCVRQALLGLQRRLATKGCVMDGRDIGTVVLPMAQAKFFLTASAPERARRRWLQLQGPGAAITLEQVIAEMAQRDERDQQRKEAPLQVAPDALHIDSTHWNSRQVTDQILATLERGNLIHPAG